MKTSPKRCVAVDECDAAARYRVRGSGPDVRTGAKSATVTIHACDTHLPAAQQRVARRSTRIIDLIPTPPDHGQPTLFDL